MPSHVFFEEARCAIEENNRRPSLFYHTVASFRERKRYHALLAAYRGDPQTLRSAARPFRSWTEAWQNLSREEKGSDPEAAWAELARAGVELALSSDTGFPAALREVPWPPLALYAKGAFDAPSERCVSIVGTRKATALGVRTAEKFAASLARAGLTIISGLAFGIDTAAHRGALAAGGRTAAVLAGGLDVIYPRANARLAEEIIAKGGALLSEYPPGSDALPRRFIERNRIVSGLSRGVIVIEAPRESGALATARFAVEQNRDVFAVPGPVNHPNYAGSHALIREGATLVTDPAEILEAFGMNPVSPSTAGVGLAGRDPDSEHILEALRRAGEPLDADAIAERASLAASVVQSRLALLVLEQAVDERGGRYFLR